MVKYYTFGLSKEMNMAGRPKIYDEDAILEKALNVFWEKGFENASADDLLKAMGIGKGSFYLAFKGGKQELFEKTMDRVVHRHFDEFRKGVQSCANPVRLVKDFFLSLVTEQSPVGDKGCYFGNALVQVSDQNLQLKLQAVKNLDILEAIFKEAMDRGKKMGLLETKLSSKELALYLVNLWNGINITKRMQHEPKALKQLMLLNLDIIA